ncbi:MAG TPA: protein kinase [Acidimicrobiales bacterium]|nr:protein kinase [Acidimicrobiales bacterium]
MNTDDPTTFAIGYELDAVAARTDHSIVFVAEQRSTGRQVAVKLAHDPDGADALRREVQVLRGLHHPHIVEVIEATATGDPWMVMPLAATSLEDACATHGAFDVDETIGVLLAIASALGAAHRHRLVHADVKPANILLAHDGRPLLADFGAAHPFGTAPTQFTPSYFVYDGIEGDVASLARCGLRMLCDCDGPRADNLRALLREFARLGDRPEVLVDAIATLTTEPRWPGVHATSPTAVPGPSTLPFGPRPPRASDRVAAPPRRSRRRIVALLAAAVVLIGAMHVARDRVAPHAPVTVEAGP